MQFGVQVVKSMDWRGGTERFANVYHYQNPVAFDSESGYVDLVNQIVAAEKAVHAVNVSFVEARVWSAGGTPAENEQIGIFDLAGAGTAAEQLSMDREAAYLVEWRTSRPSITGRPVTLKKYLHSCSLLGSTDSGTVSGRSQLQASQINALTAYGDAVRRITVGTVTNDLVAPSSVDRVAGETFVFPWIEHHELRY